MSKFRGDDVYLDQSRWCQWDPDLDLNSLGPLVRKPKRPARISKARHRLMMEMLIFGENFDQARQIMATYPYLRAEYADRVDRLEAECEFAD